MAPAPARRTNRALRLVRSPRAVTDVIDAQVRPIGAGPVRIDSVEYGDGGTKSRDLGQRQVHEDHTPLDDMHAPDRRWIPVKMRLATNGAARKANTSIDLLFRLTGILRVAALTREMRATAKNREYAGALRAGEIVICEREV